MNSAPGSVQDPAALAATDQDLNFKTMTFRQIAGMFGLAEVLLGHPGFDPDALVAAAAEKVDGCQHWDTSMEAIEAWARKQADRFLTTARSAASAKKWLREQMAIGMKENGILVLRGNAFKVMLLDSTPSRTVTPGPNAEDYQLFRKYVSMHRSYVWNEETIWEDIENGTLKLYDPNLRDENGETVRQIPARITRGVHIKYGVNVPEKFEKKARKPRAKKGVIDVESTAAAERTSEAGAAADGDRSSSVAEKADHGGAAAPSDA